MDDFKILNIEDFYLNPFEKIGKDWMLITAKKEGHTNAMTASWGGFGVMWGKNVSYVVVRPQRYTKQFMDASCKFSLCFFNESYRKTLNYFGTISGRDENKIKKAGLTVFDCNGTSAFKESELIIVCKKLYRQTLLPECFVDSSLDVKWYPNKDYHDLYVSDIEQILIK